MAKARELDDIPSYNNSDRKKPADVVDLFSYPDDKYVRMRPLPGVFSYAGHWIKASPKKNAEGKSKGGGKGGGNFYMVCAAWDADNGVRIGGNGKDVCAWCTLEIQERDLDQESKHSRFSVDHYMNAIIRSFQKTGPGDNSEEPTKKEQKTGFKDKDSETWTPVRPVRFTGGVARQIKELKQLNVHEDENGDTVASAVSDPKFGCDLMIMHSPSKPPANQYSVQKGDPSVIKKVEKTYLQWDLSNLNDPMTTEESFEEFESWAERSGISLKKGKSSKVDEDSEDDDDLPKAKKKSRPVVDDDEEDDDIPVTKKKAKAKPIEDDDLDEDDEEEEVKPKKKPVKKVVDEDDEDDEVPVKKKPAAKKKVVDDEDEDEEEAPPPKKKAKKVVDEEDFDDEDEPPKKSKKPVLADEDEEDDPPPKKKAKAKAKVVEDDDDEDEDEEPVVKKKPAAKKKIAVDDDDEDDEVPVRKKAKKRPVEDDEDDDGL